MNRPTTEETYDSFILETSWVSEKFVEPVSIQAKGYFYPYSSKAFVELRHVLDIFYKNATVKWNVKDFLKNNRAKFDEMLALLEETWDNNVIPSFKAWAYYHTTSDMLRSNPHIRQEWTISTLGLIVMLLHMGGTRREAYERDRAQAMLAGVCSELSHIEIWTYEFFMQFLDGTKNECPHRHTSNFCYHVQNDVMEWIQNSRIVGSRQKMFLWVSEFTMFELLTKIEDRTWSPKMPM